MQEQGDGRHKARVMMKSYCAADNRRRIGRESNAEEDHGSNKKARDRRLKPENDRRIKYFDLRLNVTDDR